MSLLVSLQSHDSLCSPGNVIGLSITTPLLSSEKRDCRATEVHVMSAHTQHMVVQNLVLGSAYLY